MELAVPTMVFHNIDHYVPRNISRRQRIYVTALLQHDLA